jgi:hypothetical protein
VDMEVLQVQIEFHYMDCRGQGCFFLFPVYSSGSCDEPPGWQPCSALTVNCVCLIFSGPATSSSLVTKGIFLPGPMIDFSASRILLRSQFYSFCLLVSFSLSSCVPGKLLWKLVEDSAETD